MNLCRASHKHLTAIYKYLTRANHYHQVLMDARSSWIHHLPEWMQKRDWS